MNVCGTANDDLGGSMRRIINTRAAVTAIVTIIALAVPASALAGGVPGGVVGN